MARTFRNLHSQVCSLENVMAAARAAMQGKMSGHAAARFRARWETHAVRLHEELIGFHRLGVCSQPQP